MSSNSIHIDELHAYADGRLPAARRAEVEAYLAAHPGAAAEVAAWRETDAQLHRALDPLLNEPVPQRRIPAAILGAARRPTATGFGAMRGWRVVALSVACLAIGCGAGWLSRGVVERTMPMQRFANDALVSHVVFAPESKHIVEVPADEEAHLVTWLSRRLDAQLHVPDLRSLGYRLIGGRQTVVADAPTAMLMYEGPAARASPCSCGACRAIAIPASGWRRSPPTTVCCRRSILPSITRRRWRSTGRITALGLQSLARLRGRSCWKWRRSCFGSTANSPARRRARNSATFFAMRCQVGSAGTTNAHGTAFPHNEDHESC